MLEIIFGLKKTKQSSKTHKNIQDVENWNREPRAENLVSTSIGQE